MAWLSWLKGEPAATGRTTAAARVHAVRRLPDDGYAGTRYAIELTVTPADAPCTAFDLGLSGEEGEASAAAVRVWDQAAWREAGDEPLAGGTRVRMLVDLPDGPAEGWRLRVGTDLLDEVALAHAQPLLPPEAPDPFDLRGDCARCGAYLALSRSGHCRRCQANAPCVAHPAAVSAARCVGCRQAFCAGCLINGHCGACREDAAGRRHLTARGGAAPLAATRRVITGAVDAVKRRRRQLAGLVLAAALVKGGHLAYEASTAPVIELSDAQRQVRAMETVAGALGAMRQQGGLPAGAAAIAAFMAKAGLEDAPRVIDAGKPLEPGAVVYRREGATFVLHQVDPAGKLIMDGEKPLALTRGAE